MEVGCDMKALGYTTLAIYILLLVSGYGPVFKFTLFLLELFLE